MQNNIVEILERLSNISSTNKKKKILEESKSELFSKIFKQTYDPFITFGTTKINVADLKYDDEKLIDDDWFSELFDLLKKLEKRQLTGNLAREEVRIFLRKSPEKYADLVLKILKKDLRIGVSTGIINKIYKNLLPEIICMGAMKYDEKRIFYPVYADIKLDGVRCIATIDEEVILISRNGKQYKNYQTISDELKELNLETNLKLDGEIISSHFQELMRTVSRKEGGIELAKDVIYNIFDVVIKDSMLSERLKILNKIEKMIKEKNLKHLKIIKGNVFNNEKELLDYYEACLNAGLEGIMIKKLNGIYEFKRSYSWMKMKPTNDLDLEIINVEAGTGKYSDMLGAIICRLPNGNEVNCGSGFTDVERKEYWEKREELIGQIAEIKYQELTKDNSLRFPVFSRLRYDK